MGISKSVKALQRGYHLYDSIMKSFINKNKRDHLRSQKGFSLPEIVIIVLIISIIAVLALPQIITSRELFRFSGMQREVITLLREARQEAMAQRSPITFRYQNSQRQARIFGGQFGAADDEKNRVYNFDNSGVVKDDIKYGRPGFAPTVALGDGTNLTDLSEDKVEITFQSDGSVLDVSDNPVDSAIFFFHEQHKVETAFAVSVLGSGGRVKLWRFNQGVNAYVE